MCLPRELYQSILQDVDVPVLCCLHLGLLAFKYPGLPKDTICAIFAQENQYKVLKTHHIHKAHMDTYCSRYLSGEDLLALCGEVDFPPCLMMRRMLESMMGLSKQRVSDVLKQPALLQNVDAASALQLWQQRVSAQQQQQQQQHQQQHEQHSRHAHHRGNHHSQHQQQQQPRRLQAVSSSHPSSNASSQSSGRGSSSHSGGGSKSSGNVVRSGSSSGSSGRWEPEQLLASLQVDVVRCVHADRSYSPYCDMAKSLAGLEYEAYLYQQLSAAGVPFWSEQDLRDRGLFKTPDALLQVPVCIRGPDQQWHLVHWIDSKASFGDDRTHAQQMEGQYATYVNRYGPGCVIYWFGHIADLSTSVAGGAAGGAGGSGGAGAAGEGEVQGVQQVDVLLRDTFPALEDILQL